MTAAFAPGARVRVRNDWPEARGPAHIRTPHYLRGAHGTVVRALGAFRNPEDLAFARLAPPRALYHVRFELASIWPEGRSPPDNARDDARDNAEADSPTNTRANARHAAADAPGNGRGDDLLVEIFEQWLEPA